MVSEHGSPLRMDGICVGHACMSIVLVSLTLIYLLQLLDVGLGLYYGYHGVFVIDFMKCI